MWWYIDKGNSNAKIPASMQGLLVLCSPSGLESPWCHDFGDSSLLEELGTAWGHSEWPVLWWGDGAPRGGISTEEGVKRRDVGLSAFLAWMGSKTDRRAGTLRKWEQAEGVCTLGGLALPQQRTVRHEVNWNGDQCKGKGRQLERCHEICFEYTQEVMCILDFISEKNYCNLCKWRWIHSYRVVCVLK